MKELSVAAESDPAPAEASSSAAAAAHGPSTPARPATASAATPNFIDTINRTTSRLQETGEKISSEVADSETDDFLAEMLKQMGSMSGLGDSEEDFSKMLLNMMEQLTNKDILYEPMRELADKYPGWLERNDGKHTPEELGKYREQYAFVKEICAKFEEPTYKDSSTTDREYIVERMQKVRVVFPNSEAMTDIEADASRWFASCGVDGGYERGLRYPFRHGKWVSSSVNHRLAPRLSNNTSRLDTATITSSLSFFLSFFLFFGLMQSVSYIF